MLRDYEPPDERQIPDAEYEAWSDRLTATVDDSEYSAATDPMQRLLAEAYAARLHSHDCSDCGRKQFPCASVPCEFRPFDRAGDGRRWRCHDCEAA
jgi:hypothetical protein